VLKHVAGAGGSVRALPPLSSWAASIAITGIITAATTGLAMRTMGIGPITVIDTTGRGTLSQDTDIGAPVGVITTIGTVIGIGGGKRQTSELHLGPSQVVFTAWKYPKQTRGLGY